MTTKYNNIPTTIISNFDTLSRRFIPLFVWSWPHTEPSAEKRKKLAQSFGFTFRYIDNILSLNNSEFDVYVDRIYPNEIEIKDTTEKESSVSYVDLCLEINSKGGLRTEVFDKRDEFYFPTINFPFMSNNIPVAYWV